MITVVELHRWRRVTLIASAELLSFVLLLRHATVFASQLIKLHTPKGDASQSFVTKPIPDLKLSFPLEEFQLIRGETSLLRKKTQAFQTC